MKRKLMDHWKSVRTRCWRQGLACLPPETLLTQLPVSQKGCLTNKRKVRSGDMQINIWDWSGLLVELRSLLQPKRSPDLLFHSAVLLDWASPTPRHKGIAVSSFPAAGRQWRTAEIHWPIADTLWSFGQMTETNNVSYLYGDPSKTHVEAEKDSVCLFLNRNHKTCWSKESRGNRKFSFFM